MKKTLILSLLAFITVFPTLTFGKTIDIECSFRSQISYDVINKLEQNPDSDTLHDIKKFAIDQDNWSQWLKSLITGSFFNTTEKIIFSIDTKTSTTILDINSNLPHDFIPYLYNTNKKLPTEISATQIKITNVELGKKIWKIQIDRIKGGLFGHLFAASYEYKPIFKENDVIYWSFGKCKPMEKRF